MFATSNQIRVRTHDALSVTFKQPVSSAAIAALQTKIEANYKVTFSYSGNEYDYSVVLTGSEMPFVNAMSTLFPKGRDDILIQPSSI